MVETFKLIFVLFVSFFLIVNGAIVIKKRHFEIGIGGRGTRPVFSIPIKGIGAITFGIFSLIAGFLVLAYVALKYLRQELASLDTAFSLGIVMIIGLLAIGMVIGFLLQILMGLLDTFGAKNEKHSK